MLHIRHKTGVNTGSKRERDPLESHPGPRADQGILLQWQRTRMAMGADRVLGARVAPPSSFVASPSSPLVVTAAVSLTGAVSAGDEAVTAMVVVVVVVAVSVVAGVTVVGVVGVRSESPAGDRLGLAEVVAALATLARLSHTQPQLALILSPKAKHNAAVSRSQHHQCSNRRHTHLPKLSSKTHLSVTGGVLRLLVPPGECTTGTSAKGRKVNS